MNYDIHGHGVKITEGMKEHIISKLDKIEKYFAKKEDVNIKVVVRVSGSDQIIEVNIPIKQHLIRAEERDNDLYTAIDMVVNKLERQIKRNKEKIRNHFSNESIKMLALDNVEDEENIEEVIKYKKLETKPMCMEEAIMQMNLVDHDFFIYKDSDTCEINVLYRRKDGKYGVIETS